MTEQELFEISVNNWLEEQYLAIDEDIINIGHGIKLIDNYQKSIVILKDQVEAITKRVIIYINDNEKECKIDKKYIDFFKGDK